MLLNKKPDKLKSKILFFIILVILILFVVGIWRFSPLFWRTYANFFNNSILRPISTTDNLTKLTTMLAQANLPVVSLQNYNQDSLVASLSGNLQVTFSLQKDLSNQVATLQVILERFRIEGRKVSRIDLRFNNVVVE